jgi:hypothetical protein
MWGWKDDLVGSRLGIGHVVTSGVVALSSMILNIVTSNIDVHDIESDVCRAWTEAAEIKIKDGGKDVALDDAVRVATGASR